MDFKQRYKKIIDTVLPSIPDTITQRKKTILTHIIKALASDHIFDDHTMYTDDEMIDNLKVVLMSNINIFSQDNVSETNENCHKFVIDTMINNIHVTNISISTTNKKFWNMAINEAYSIYVKTNNLDTNDAIDIFMK